MFPKAASITTAAFGHSRCQRSTQWSRWDLRHTVLLVPPPQDLIKHRPFWRLREPNLMKTKDNRQGDEGMVVSVPNGHTDLSPPKACHICFILPIRDIEAAWD